MCETLGEFETYMGHEIAMQIKLAKERNEKIAFILPVGPMGMYKWVVYFIKEQGIPCDHFCAFNMEECVILHSGSLHLRQIMLLLKIGRMHLTELVRRFIP